jgi:hypothetical protein
MQLFSLFLCVGAVYFTLANIDPAFRSRLEAINLIALFNSDLLSEYSLDDVLKPFVNELKELNAVRLLFGIYIWGVGGVGVVVWNM